MNYQDKPHRFHIEETWIVCPTDESIELKCYMLCDEEQNAVWTNGHPFGFIWTMNQLHGSSDCRYLMMMRASPEWTWEHDAPEGAKP